MSTNWFITGASRGFGHAFAKAALERGDRVAATARDTASLTELAEKYGDALIPLPLNVTDGAAVTVAVREAEQRLDGLDVVVNNAGYGHFGAVEEITDTELRDQLETNLFGPQRVVRAVLPGMRARGHGHIIQVSSLGGIGAFTNLGAYHASKWALEAISESLALEVARFGVRVTIVEPGAYGTDWAGSSARHSIPHATYEPMRDEAAARRGTHSPGEPAAAAQALLDIVNAPEPPLRVLFGAQTPSIVRGIYQGRLAHWDDWAELATTAHGTPTEEARA